MGEVGTNSSDNPHADLKMNGGINGNCEDDAEAMDVDAQDPTVSKNADSSDQLPATDDSTNVVESENDGNSGVDLITSENEIETEDVKEHENESENENNKQNNDIETMAHENGADKVEEKCDQEPTEEAISDESMVKNAIEEVSESDMKIDEDADSPVKVSSDPLSTDAEPIDDDKRTNQSQPQSTENGTSATITSSSDKKGKSTNHKRTFN